jgi:ABC-type polysaccharide/polyol phosphate export permease
MKVNEEGFKEMRRMCCGPWLRHSHTGFRFTIGILLILIGFLWFGARMGWVDLTWIHAVPFWPVIVIAVGICLVYRGLTTKKVFRSENHREV